jgi:hypothetical protein
VPVIIHLIARHRARRTVFPSLKFIPAAPVPALRRRVITEWPLLVVRISILVIATAALAGPVFVSAGRRAEWNQRVARATLSTLAEEAGARPRIADERGSSFLHAHFASPRLPDAIRDAVDWLGRQPPAARELVVIGDLREGLLTERDLDAIPPTAGVRFVTTTGAAVGAVPRPRLIAEAGSGRPTQFELDVEPALLNTTVKYAPTAGAEPRVTIDGGPASRAHADAVLRAILREGVLLSGDGSREVVIAFDGATLADGKTPPGAAWMREALERIPEARGSERNGALIVRVAMPVTDRRAPSIVARVVAQAFSAPFAQFEPRRISPVTLQSWSRPPGPSPAGVLPADEGDRRWFWAAVLLLIGVEHLLRGEGKRPRAGA